MRPIPYSHQSISADDIRAVVRALRSEWLTQGPAVVEFEQALARYTRARFAVVFSSGTTALHAAYSACGIRRGDTLITSPLTFAATANAALWQGARPVFADIEVATGNIDPAEVLKKITRRTKAIVAVDYAGLPSRLAELKSIAIKHGLVLIEDAAHALGASYGGRKIGSISDMTIFSFHPIKSITTAEGGAVTTGRRDFYERLILFRNHGITRERRLLHQRRRADWYYEMQALGLNGRLSDIQSALGTSQLKRLPRFLKERRAIAERYHEALSDLPAVVLPGQNRAARSSWHLYPVRLAGIPARRRDEIFKALRRAGIGVQVHYIPVYWHPYYRGLGYRRGLCPRAEDFFRSELSLPIFPGLPAHDQRLVIRTLRRLLTTI